MIALHPMLQLAGAVTGVGAGFEHGDDDDFDGDGRVRGCARGQSDGAEE